MSDNTMADQAIRVPGDMIARLEQLHRAEGLERLEGLAGCARISRAALLRLALRRGLAALEEELRGPSATRRGSR